jgi:hypothetical protein
VTIELPVTIERPVTIELPVTIERPVTILRIGDNEAKHASSEVKAAMTDLNGAYYSDSERNFLNSEWLCMNSEVWLAIGHLSGVFLGLAKYDSLVMNNASLYAMRKEPRIRPRSLKADHLIILQKGAHQPWSY